MASRKDTSTPAASENTGFIPPATETLDSPVAESSAPAESSDQGTATSDGAAVETPAEAPAPVEAVRFAGVHTSFLVPIGVGKESERMFTGVVVLDDVGQSIPEGYREVSKFDVDGRHFRAVSPIKAVYSRSGAMELIGLTAPVSGDAEVKREVASLSRKMEKAIGNLTADGKMTREEAIATLRAALQ